MALYFTNVKLLEYTHTPVSLGAGLRYRLEKQFKITGRLLDETYSGPLALLQQQDLLLGRAVDYQDINLNGVSFGAGSSAGSVPRAMNASSNAGMATMAS